MYTVMFHMYPSELIGVPLYNIEIKSITPIPNSDKCLFNIRFPDESKLNEFCLRFGVKTTPFYGGFPR